MQAQPNLDGALNTRPTTWQASLKIGRHCTRRSSSRESLLKAWLNNVGPNEDLALSLAGSAARGHAVGLLARRRLSDKRWRMRRHNRHGTVPEEVFACGSGLALAPVRLSHGQPDTATTKDLGDESVLLAICCRASLKLATALCLVYTNTSVVDPAQVLHPPSAYDTTGSCSGLLTVDHAGWILLLG